MFVEVKQGFKKRFERVLRHSIRVLFVQVQLRRLDFTNSTHVLSDCFQLTFKFMTIIILVRHYFQILGSDVVLDDQHNLLLHGVGVSGARQVAFARLDLIAQLVQPRP
jgi:hypothetical protein